MPGLSGLHALPLFNAIAPDIPVMALSGHVPDDATLELASAVPGKPLGQQEMMAVLRDLVGG
jgi:CheY-like chemotaxis protein